VLLDHLDRERRHAEDNTDPSWCAGRTGWSWALVCDANYPATTRRGPRADLVHLNLRPGLVNAVEVLECLLGVVPVEESLVMAPLVQGPYAHNGEPPIWAEFRTALSAAGAPSDLLPLPRQEFYETASCPDVALTIVSGEARIYGNLLLRVGVVHPPT